MNRFSFLASFFIFVNWLSQGRDEVRGFSTDFSQLSHWIEWRHGFVNLSSHCSWSGQRTAIPATNQWAAISAIDLIGSLSCIRAKEQCSIQPWCWWSCDGCFSMYTKKEQTCKPVFSCVMPFLESNILQGWKRVSWRCRSKSMLFSKLLNGHTATKVACSIQPYTALNSPCPWNVHLGHALPCSISRRGDCCNAYGTTSILPEIFGVIWRKLSQSDPKAVL